MGSPIVLSILLPTLRDQNYLRTNPYIVPACWMAITGLFAFQFATCGPAIRFKHWLTEKCAYVDSHRDWWAKVRLTTYGVGLNLIVIVLGLLAIEWCVALTASIQHLAITSQSSPSGAQTTTKALTKAELEDALKGLEATLKSVPQTKTSRSPRRISDLHIIFKHTPLLTKERRHLISERMDHFYDYLVEAGFSPTREISIGTIQGKTFAAAISEPGPAYMNPVSIPEERIDDPATPIQAYAMYCFPKLFDANNPNRGDENRRLRIALVYQGYFVASFCGARPPMGKSDISQWISALWKIRQEISVQASDELCFFAFRTFNEVVSLNLKEEFSESLYHSITEAQHVFDNYDSTSQDRRTKIYKILADSGLTPLAH